MDNRNSSAINFAKMEKVAKVSVIRSSQSPVPEKRKNQKGFLSGRGYKFILAILAMFFFGFSMAQEVLAGGSSPCSMTVPASGIVIRSASSLSDTTIGSGTAICTVNAPANGAVDNDCTTSGDGGLTQDTFYRFEMAVANSGGTDCTVDLSNHSALVNGLMSQLIASFGSCTAGDIGSTTAVACTQTGNGVFVTGSYSVPGGATRWAAYTFKTPTSNNTVNTTGYRHATSGATATSDTNNIQVLPDTIPPQWSNNWSRTAVTYSPLNFSVFNITWTDNIKVYPGGVLFESNFTGVNTNYTMQNTSNVYNYSAIYPAGVFYWKSYANDTSGNRNMTYNWTFIIARETTLLNLTLNGTAGNFTMEYGPSIYLNGSVYRGDNITIQLYRNSSLLISNYSQISNFSLFDLPGIFNITLVYLQSQNYTDARITYYINVTDRQPPNITLLAPENNGFDNDGNVNFRFNVTDASEIDSCRFFYVGYGPPIAQNFSVNKNLIQEFVQTGLDEDTYSWLVNCTDNRTNEGTSSVYTVTVDQTEPEVVLTTPLNASWDLDGSVQMSFTVADLNKNLCSLYANFTGIWHANQTDSAPDEGANSFNSTTISDGVYVWNVFCNDSATNLDWGGSTAALDENYTIYIDSISPQVNYSGPMPSTNQNTTVTTVVVNVTHFDANPDTVIFNFNGTLSYIRYTGTYTNLTYTGLQGHYQFNVSINDSAGHTNSTETRSIKIDNVAPRLYIESPGTVAYDTDGLAVFRFNATDQTLGIKNCSLYLDSGLASTNATVQQGVSQDFTQALLNGTYSWYISCSDYIPNINNSDARTLTVDTTSPYIRNETINATSFNVQGHACLIVFVNDSHSSISEVRIKVQKPSGLTDWLPLANSSTSCGLGGLNWSASFTNDESGTYYWNITNATDLAGNYFARSPPETITWTATSNYFLNVTLVQPLADFELNESSFMNNYSYLQTCNVSCSELSSGDCTGVVLKAEFNNESLSPSAWYPLTRNTTQLRGNVDNLSCGTLSNSGGYCNQTFNVTVGTAAGGNIYGLRCAAFSTNAGAETSELFVNLTINDYPVAAFTFPSNGSYLNGIEILNASASTDDQGVSLYTFELDNAADFANAYPLCSSALTNCTFNTSAQANCAEDSWNCFIRLNVTDSDGLKNSTTIQVMIDNTPPAVSLAWPANNYWFSTSTITLNYTATDTKLNACVLYLNESGSFISNETNSTVVNNTASSFTTTARDRTFAWNIFCNDSAGNGAFNSSNRTVNVDTAYPNISFTLGTEDNNTFFARNFIFINVTAADPNQANLTFFLYNSTSRLVNATAIYAWGLSNGTLNFSNLGIVDQAYYYNVTILDRAGNANTTGARKITLDNTAPQVGFGVGTAENNSYYSRGWIYANVSVNESNFANITFYLYNSAFSLVNATNYTSGIFFVNFTGLADSNEVYYYNVTVWDRVSFEASTVAYRITLDNIAPGVRLDGPGDNSWSPASQVDFYYTPSDTNIASCTLYHNASGSFAANETNSTVANGIQDTISISLPDGSWQWNVFCNDSAGNGAFNSSNRTVNVDTQNPNIDFDSGTAANNSYFNRNWIFVNVSVTEINYANITFYLYDSNFALVNATNYTTGTFYVNFTSLSDVNEAYHYNVTVWDKASKYNSTVARVITLDSLNPNVNYASPTPPDNTNQTQTSLVVNVTLSDANSNSVTLNFNGSLTTEAISVSYANFTIQGLGDGVYAYNVTANDSAGNSNTTLARTVRIDNTPPWLYPESPLNNSWIGNHSHPVVYKYNVTDAILSVSNCSLYVNGLLNQTNYSLAQATSLNFTQAMPSGYFNWSVSCSDALKNENYTGNRSLRVDLTYPVISDASINMTSLNITTYLCLNVTVTDTFSGVNATYAKILDPDGIYENVFMNETGTGSCGDADGNNVYWVAYKANKVGIFNWTATYANDTAGNINSSIAGLLFNSSSIATLTANMTFPLSNFQINESEDYQNYTYRQECRAYCNGNDGVQNCTEVYLYAQYNLSGAAADITTASSFLVNYNNSYYCGNLTEGDQGDYCAYNFTIRTSATAGMTAWKINCRAGSATIGTYTSFESINLTVNDHPNASFAYPKNSTWLHGVEILNGSDTTDDKPIIRYAFEIDDNAGFSSPGLVCDTADQNCTLNTLSQTQCENESYACYLRLNVTDSDWLENSTTTNIGIDNLPPRIVLGAPSNNTWSNESAVKINYTATDINLDTCTVYHNASGPFAANVSNGTVDSGVRDSISIPFPDGNFVWNVYCNDTETNAAFNATNRTLNVDTVYPSISFAGGTEANNTYFPRDYIFVNLSITESHFANLTFYLYNSTFELINLTVYRAVQLTGPTNASINFSYLEITNGVYYYNATMVDLANNINSTETRKITLDNTNPTVDYAGPTPIDNYNQSSTSFIVNVTHSETNPDKALLNFNGTQYLLSYAGASTNFTLAGITHGYYVYNVTVNDSAGNSAQTAGRVIRIDRIPPFISLEAPGNNTWKPANTTFYYNVTDDLLFPGNCSLVVNGTINETDYTISEQASQNFTMYNFAEGYYSWAINCTDTVDNQNNSIAYIFKIDRTGPVSILDRPSNFTNISANVYMLNATVTDGEVGVNTTIFEYSQNLGQSFQAACIDQDGSDSYNCSWDISSLPDSRLYQVRVRANDSFGTYGEYFTKYNITLDRAAPVITLLNPGNNSRDLDGTVLFRYNVTDVTSGIGNCSLIINNEVNATNYTVLGNNTNNFTIYLAEDVYNWSVNCTDTAGNVNSSVSYNLSVEPDRASPRVNLNLPLNNTISTITTINFYFNVTDALSEIANCSIFINHTLNQTDSTIAKNATQSFEVSGFNDNSYSWQINCTDNSSGYYNVGTSDLYNLTVSRATNLYVSVLSNKLLYEVDKSTGLGENATITVNVSDKFGNKLRANITADVIYLNTSNVPVIWWNVSYKYRTRVNITNSENLAQNWSRVLLANYTVNFTMDTATLIAAGKMQADGDDLRVAYWNNDTGNWTQLDRLVFGINSLYTSVWFKTIADIPINTSEIRYYIYYGNNSAGNPPANRSNVYFYYEGFDANTTSLYNLSKDFEDLSEDVAGTIQYDATNKWLNHSASGAFGKSIRKNIPLADSIIEVSHYYNDRNGLLNRMEVASMIDGDTYYYFYTTSNIEGTVLNRYNGGAKEDPVLASSATTYSTKNQWYRLTLETYSNDSTTFLKGYVDDTLLLSYNDSSPERIVAAGGFGAGEFRTIGYWDNLSVRRKTLVGPNLSSSDEEAWIYRKYNESGGDGSYKFNFTTTGSQFGNYSVVALAHNDNYLNGLGFVTFELTPDVTSPAITLRLPVNDDNITVSTAVFNWTASDSVDTNASCNVTVNGNVEAQNVNSPRDQTMNISVPGLPEGANFWNVTCWDDSNNTNTSVTWNFTVIAGPSALNASLDDDNASVILDWNNILYADSFNIYIIDDFNDEFGETPNITGITDSNYTDSGADGKPQRYYKVSTVRGNANKTSSIIVGKYDIELVNNTNAVSDWNLISLPFNISNFELNNGTNNGYNFAVRPASCLWHLYAYNSTTDSFDKTDFNGTAWRPAAGSDNFTHLEIGRGYWAEVNKTCNITFVGQVPTINVSVNLTQGWNVVGWYSPNESALPQDYNPPYPVVVNPANSVVAIDRYNPYTDLFEVTIHYVIAGTPWGWFPSFNNLDFLTMEPGKGYYFDVTPPAYWQHEPNTNKG